MEAGHVPRHDTVGASYVRLHYIHGFIKGTESINYVLTKVLPLLPKYSARGGKRTVLGTMNQ